MIAGMIAHSEYMNRAPQDHGSPKGGYGLSVSGGIADIGGITLGAPSVRQADPWAGSARTACSYQVRKADQAQTLR